VPSGPAPTIPPAVPKGASPALVVILIIICSLLAIALIAVLSMSMTRRKQRPF
jgi:hypothetical protein